MLFAQLVSKFFNLCGHDPPTSQTDGQTTCDLKTTLCTIVHRAVEMYKRTRCADPPDLHRINSIFFNLLEGKTQKRTNEKALINRRKSFTSVAWSKRRNILITSKATLSRPLRPPTCKGLQSVIGHITR